MYQSAPGGDGKVVWLDQGVDDVVTNTVKEMGNNVRVPEGWKHIPASKGQILRQYVDEETELAEVSGGSDGRADCAMRV